MVFIPWAAAIIWVGGTDTAGAQKVAELSAVQGNVRVFEAGSSRGKRGRDGMALFAQGRILTIGSQSMADIVYIQGGAVRIMPNSEVVLLSTDFSTGNINAQLTLAAGKIFNVVTKLTEGSTYEVRTLTATAGVKGTIFSAETTGKRSVFMVKEGMVEVVGNQQPVLVADLKKTSVDAGQP
ncbi:MAG: FecR domain-containing protein, partial [Nitrospinaceae bacterium]